MSGKPKDLKETIRYYDHNGASDKIQKILWQPRVQVPDTSQYIGITRDRDP